MIAIPLSTFFSKKKTMNKTIIHSPSHELYPAFESVYTTSFPIFEQCTTAQQEAAFANSRYRLVAYTDDRNDFIGFMGLLGV